MTLTAACVSLFKYLYNVYVLLDAVSCVFIADMKKQLETCAASEAHSQEIYCIVY